MEKKLNLEMLMEDVKMLKEFGFTHEEAMSMAREKQGFEPLATSVAVAKQEVEEPAKPKFYKVAENYTPTWSKEGRVVTPSYPKCGKLLASALWHKNNALVKAEFGDDVVWKNDKAGYHCESDKVATKLMKFQLSNGVTVDEWNAWAEYKADGLMKQVEYYESLMVKIED